GWPSPEAWVASMVSALMVLTARIVSALSSMADCFKLSLDARLLSDMVPPDQRPLSDCVWRDGHEARPWQRYQGRVRFQRTGVVANGRQRDRGAVAQEGSYALRWRRLSMSSRTLWPVSQCERSRSVSTRRRGTLVGLPSSSMATKFMWPTVHRRLSPV